MDEAPKGPHDTLVLSYLELRKSVGVIGIMLPVVLVIGSIVLGSAAFLGSISAYYYSIMGGVFVGSLCANGVFLWSYRGYDARDVIAGHVAALCAIGLALFPTSPIVGATAGQQLVGILHLVFAFGFFVTLIYFALVLFRITKSGSSPTPEKIMRNRVYTICGYTMIACLVLLVILALLPNDSSVFALNPVFWLETILIEAFGISWLVKGEAILSDK